MSARETIHDPKVLRAIAHPVRNRTLTELTASGPMRAADLARELPANQMSFHLRQLAKYGLVEEAPDAARDRRDRVWLTRDAAVEVAAEMDTVLARWVERTRGRDDGRRTYLYFSVLQPYPEEQ